MDFEDLVLVRLADPTTRGAVFDQDALAGIAAAGYDHPELEGPFQAAFDELQLAVDAQQQVRADGYWQRPGDPSSTELHLSISGFAPEPVLGVTALWRGSVLARVNAADTPVTAAALAQLDEERVDAGIISALGALPADPAALEAARRDQVRVILAAAAGTPVLTDDGELARWLELVGADSVSAWLARADQERSQTYLRIGFAPAAPATTPRSLPVTVAVLARDAGTSLAALLAQTATLRQRLQDAGREPVPDLQLRRRVPIIVAWVLPSTVFDDAGWPGAGPGTPQQQRQARRLAAAAWLGDQGIGLAVLDPP